GPRAGTDAVDRPRRGTPRMAGPGDGPPGRTTAHRPLGRRGTAEQPGPGLRPARTGPLRTAAAALGTAAGPGAGDAAIPDAQPDAAPARLFHSPAGAARARQLVPVHRPGRGTPAWAGSS